MAEEKQMNYDVVGNWGWPRGDDGGHVRFPSEPVRVTVGPRNYGKTYRGRRSKAVGTTATTPSSPPRNGPRRSWTRGFPTNRLNGM